MIYSFILRREGMAIIHAFFLHYIAFTWDVKAFYFIKSFTRPFAGRVFLFFLIIVI
ncbi:hypothetical protein Ctaglu_43640 [Clostridium tagluense]|uniref:Uncharacterized protein n=1 Tax=Clostridium tagluense TaxID=360422 RepID=A0A401UTA3_9CLOT|nr:hypothetical protein Ctaglu_43640 [Clostridium tagluense]